MLFSNWFLYYLRIENKVCVNSIGYELPRHPFSLGGLRLARHFTWQTRPARHGREPRKVLLRWSAFLFSVRPSNTSTCICPPLSAIWRTGSLRLQHILLKRWGALKSCLPSSGVRSVELFESPENRRPYVQIPFGNLPRISLSLGPALCLSCKAAVAQRQWKYIAHRVRHI